MPHVGIERLGVYCGVACLDVQDLARARQLDRRRIDNLLIAEKSVPLPCEDVVSFAVNAARPIVDALTPAERGRIEMLVTCTESGIDFGKSVSTYVHHYLGLSRTCRLFELKTACYAGTAGLQTAVNFILSGTSPGAKALVICSDLPRTQTVEGEGMMDAAYAEPASGAGAIALLVSDRPDVLRLDAGANGYYGYEVMDTCRPTLEQEAGHPELSLLSYLQCCTHAFANYAARVAGADYRASFDALVFHTPFGGMVRGAHRAMLRRLSTLDLAAIEADFDARVAPGLRYCQRVGNIMSGALFLALASTLESNGAGADRRIGLFSYGSGCCSEFYSGIAGSASAPVHARDSVAARLDARCPVTPSEYDDLVQRGRAIGFGTRDWRDVNPAPICRRRHGTGWLRLVEIANFHRKYDWD